MQTPLFSLHAATVAAAVAMELLGAMSANISPHHKDGLVLVLWISLSLIHTFLTYSLRRGGVRLSTTKLGGVGVTGVTSSTNSLLKHCGMH